MHNIADLRKEYSQASLDVSTANKDPIEQVKIWLDDAIRVEAMEPTAMNLATVGEGGRPTARIVLLKGLENGMFQFYTNYQSQKGKNLEKNPACALTFFWPELERQIRIEGIATRVSESQSDIYFKSRPKGSQMGAWASPQSAAISGRELLDERMAQIEIKFKDASSLPRPHQWGGFKVDPFLIEFWQGRPNRLHDRICYIRDNGTWTKQRLAP
jgi:pyridoxamine 5'-phosphate oxidase